MSCFPDLSYSMYADGEMPADEAGLIEAHLAACSRCRTLVDGLRAENRLLADALCEADAEFLPLFAAQRAPRFGPSDWLTVAAVLLAAIAGLRGLLAWRAEWEAPEAFGWLDIFRLDAQLNLFFAGLFYLLEEGASMLATAASVVSVLTVVLLIFIGARLLRRLPPKAAGMLCALALALSLPGPASAIETRRGQIVTVAEGQSVDDTLVATGETVQIDGVVNGDLIAFGQRVTIKGTVKGSAICFARNVHVEGTVEGNLYSVSQSVNIRGAVARSLFSFAQQLEIASTGRVEADSVVLSSQARLDGAVGRDLSGFTNNTQVAGNVGRNLTARAARVTLEPAARVGGNFTAYVRNRSNVHIASGASVTGKTETHIRRRPNRFLRPGFYFWLAVRLAAALLAGWLMIRLAPGLFEGSVQRVQAWPRSLGLGFAILVAAPAGAVILGITLVGLPLAFLTLAVYLAALYLSKIFVAAWLGGRLLGRPMPATSIPSGLPATQDSLPALFVGLVVILAATQLPYAGFLLNLGVVCLGLGAFAHRLYTGVHSQA